VRSTDTEAVYQPGSQTASERLDRSLWRAAAPRSCRLCCTAQKFAWKNPASAL